MELALEHRFGVQMLLYMSIRAGNEIAITVLYNAAGRVLSSQLGRERPRSLESSVSRPFCCGKSNGGGAYAYDVFRAGPPRGCREHGRVSARSYRLIRLNGIRYICIIGI